MNSGLQSLLWFGLIAIFFFLMMRGGCGSHVMGHGRHSNDGQPPGSGNGPSRMQTGTAVDPVCGRQVDPVSAKSSMFRGQAYFFCSAEHRDAFEADPERYIRQRTVPASSGEHHAHG